MGTSSLWSTIPLDQSEAEFDDSTETELLSVNWNQNYECLSVGTRDGFRIYNCDAFTEALRRNLQGWGFKIVEMLFRSDIMALVGSAANSPYPPNNVLIWSDSRRRFISELRFRSNVRGVKLREDYIVIVLENKIYVYNFTDLVLVHEITTHSNLKGLCCISHHSNNWVLVCPGKDRGEVRVDHFGLKLTKLINAHDSQIACMTLTLDGLLLATASTKGTLIRIFNTEDGTQLQEVRRGLDRADIYSIAFSPNVQWLVVSSDKGTIHVFSLQFRSSREDASTQLVAAQSPEVKYQKSISVDSHLSRSTRAKTNSSLYFMRGFLPKYFSSEWSFAQFYMREHTNYIAAFGAQNTVLIAGMDGSFYRCTFNPINGGKMSLKDHIQFVKH
ncbi:hypothetical protein Cni_G04595 [Canna indica]|uniref:Autophagy-related protein 18c n=1 Tax=Canna indica TaxID=4628 RepID=A0AAQ3Q2U2_9LILI|nr:hypothetical protein Cni_G04595 [Canna indica]